MSSLDRHRRNCLAPKVANAFARHAELDADRLRGWAVGLLETAATGLTRSRHAEVEAATTGAEPGELRAFRAEQRAYAGEMRKAIELVGRLGGFLGDGRPTIQVDARRQIAVLASLDENELRALARSAQTESVVELPAATPARV